jgi:hypothetical protein
MKEGVRLRQSLTHATLGRERRKRCRARPTQHDEGGGYNAGATREVQEKLLPGELGVSPRILLIILPQDWGT